MKITCNVQGMIRKMIVLSGFLCPFFSHGQLVTIGGGNQDQSNYPVKASYKNSASEMIYSGAVINTTGNITKLGFYQNNANSQVVEGVSIYMKTGTETVVSTTTSYTTSLSGYTLVWSGTFPTGAIGWKTVDLNTPFPFLSTGQNLRILVVRNSATYSVTPPTYKEHSVTGRQSGYYANDNTAWSASSSMSTASYQPDAQFTFVSAAPCSGTPAPGNTLSTLAAACPGETFTLSLQNSTVGSGVSYQWQSSPNGISWTNISGANSSVLSTTQNAATYYQCIVSCAGNSGTSNSIAVNYNGPVYTSLPVSESFESWSNLCGTSNVPANYWFSTPATGNNSWRRNDQGSTATWTSATTGAYTPAASVGTYSARFHSSYNTAGTKGSLDLYVNCNVGGAQKQLTFDYINTNGTDKLNVFVSTDGGLNFTAVGSDMLISTPWTQKTITFSSGSATTIVRFQATSDYGSTDLGIDNVRITTIPDCSAVAFPASVNATASKTAICSEEPINFGLSSAMPLANGITYQWKSSADNSTYINAGAPGISVDATLTANAGAKWFKCEILCNGNVVLTSSAVQVTIQVEVLTTTPGNRCGTGTVNLSATSGGSNTLQWYAAASGGNAIGTGNSFTTPTISSNTDYYVSAKGAGSTVRTGPANPSFNSSRGSTNNGDGQIFNLAQGVTLQSVTIYPVDAATNNRIFLKDASGNTLMEKTFAVTAAQATSTNSVIGNPVVVTLDWNIPVGTGYKLVWDVPGFYGENRVLRNTSGAAAYYNVTTGGLTFTGNVSGFGTSYWYNFYDWVIVTGCGESPRVPVSAVVRQNEGGTVSSDQVSCIYGTPSDLSLSGNSGNILKWQRANNASFVAPTEFATTASTLTGAQIGALTETNYFRAVVQNTGCPETYSANAVIKVNPLPTTISMTDNPSTGCNIMSPDHWAMLVAPDNTLIACVLDAAGGNNLGAISSLVQIKPNVQVHNALSYMQRIVTITPVSNGAATVRLFFTQAEYDNLRAADPTLTSISQLGVTKFPGSTVAGTGQYIIPTQTTTPAETGMPGVYALDIPVTGFSTFIIHKGINGAPLPISLTDFNVRIAGKRKVEISWSTYSESNNDYFTIERSSDAEHFHAIGEPIDGAGNSSSLLKYAVFDLNPALGVNYYRLKQTDFDGKFSYSETRAVSFTESQDVVKLFPNPASNGSALQIKIAEATEVFVQISASNGEIVETITQHLEAGTNTVYLGKSLKAGVYNVSVRDQQSLNENLKLVVIQ